METSFWIIGGTTIAGFAALWITFFVSIRKDEDEQDELFEVADMPPNTDAWLLYTAPTRLVGNYTQGELASNVGECSLPLAPLEDALVSNVYVQTWRRTLVRPASRMCQD